MDLSLPSGKVIDVSRFFDETTDAYLEFQNRVTYLNDNLRSYSVTEIAEECNRLRLQQQALTALDQEIVNILNLIGSTVSLSPLISDYRDAFSLASAACDDLSINLNKLKTSLSLS